MGLRAWFQWLRGGRPVRQEERGVVVSCLETDLADVPRLSALWEENTTLLSSALPESTAVRQLVERAVDPRTLAPDGWYTSPRSYGVYEVDAPPAGVLTYHFGNHPVRQRELRSQYPKVRLVSVFLEREDAKALADLLNA